VQDRFDEQRRGATLILVTLSMVAAGLLGAALLSGVSGSRMQRVHYDSGARGVYAAESGKAFIEARLREDRDYTPAGTYILASGDQFTASGTYVGNFINVSIQGMAYPGTRRENIHGLFFRFDRYAGGGEEFPYQFYGDELVTRAAGAVRVRGSGVAIIRDGASYTGNTAVQVANIYVGGDLTLGGTSSMGDPNEASLLYVEGDVTLSGSARIYGDLYLTGTFSGNASRVSGTIFYGFNEDDLPDFVRLARDTERQPALRTPDQWYYDHGYTSDATTWTSNMRMFALEDYVSAQNRPTTTNVVIVGKGDIRLNMEGSPGTMLTGILFAPAGMITLDGKGFTGTVIARDGFYTTAGNTEVTFQDMSNFIDNPELYPLVFE